MKKLIFIVALLNCFIVFISSPVVILAQSNLLINEFSSATSQEWVEIYNNSQEKISLEGVALYFDANPDTTQKLTFCQDDFINVNSYRLINAKGSWLNNTGDILILKKNDAILDTIAYGGSNPLKAPTSSQSVTRMPDGVDNWIITNSPTPQGDYAIFECLTPTQTPTPIPTPTETSIILPTVTPILTSAVSLEPILTPTPTSYDSIFINEAMVNPETGNNEWVELYNNNDFSVSLTNWFIDDLENAGSTPKAFSLEIPSKNYHVFNLSSSIFNNDGDSVRLLDFNKSLKDSFEYDSSTQGKTWGRIDINNDNFCLQEPSYEFVNNPCLNPTTPQTPTQPPIKTLTPTKTIMINSKTIIKPTNYNVSTLPAGRQVHRSINYPTIYMIKNLDNGEILGISSVRPNNNSLVRSLSFVSLSYSLLTILAVLFKMKLLYGKGKKLFSAFIYTNRTE